MVFIWYYNGIIIRAITEILPAFIYLKGNFIQKPKIMIAQPVE